MTIFDEVKNSMKIAREEIFGTVLSVIPVKSEEEAVKLANETSLRVGCLALHPGCECGAIGSPVRCRAGTVSVNGFSEGDMTTPFGGYKESGFAGMG